MITLEKLAIMLADLKEKEVNAIKNLIKQGRRTN